MKSVQDVRKYDSDINSACNVVNLQSESVRTVHEPIEDSDLNIDVNSDIQSCDYSDIDYQKCYLPNEYNFEQDLEKLIRVSKQFQKEYESENVKKIGGAVQESKKELNTEVLTVSTTSLIKQLNHIFPTNEKPDVENYYLSNFSSRGSSTSRSKKENTFSVLSTQRKNNTSIQKLPNQGPFGTGLIRPRPKIHSCIPRNDVIPAKHSHRAAWNIRPYSIRYYDFGRTHPHLELVDNGDSIIPKRILKRTTPMNDETTLKNTITKPLLNKGITWHEFFERGNVYSAKSLQSSHGDGPSHTICTQTAFSESMSPTINENIKIQKHILPQLNIRAECSVQRIPEISIAPNVRKCTVNSNIKLVEIIYEEPESEVIESPRNERIVSKNNDMVNEQLQYQSNSDYTAEINQNTQIRTSTVSSTSPSKISSNHGYDSSLEESISLNVSRVSALTDHEASRRVLLPDRPRKLKKFVKYRKDANSQHGIISTSDYSDFEYDDLTQPPQVTHGGVLNIKLPSFPTNELIQMVDEIFDTSSDGWTENIPVNVRYKQFVKETSVQTDIVWENINDFLRQQKGAIKEPTSQSSDNIFSNFITKPRENTILSEPSSKAQIIETETLQLNAQENQEIGDHHFVTTTPVESGYSNTDVSEKRDITPKYCAHTRLKKFKICSCLACKSNIKFSVMNINHSSQSQHKSSSTSSSSATIEISQPKPAVRTSLLPSERYKQMKQAQREHFENDPRISKTLKNIYQAAKRVREKRISSSSSSHYHLNDSPCPSDFPNCALDESLQPDLFTISDEALLFGLHATDFQYSSYLLKTESSQDTTTSNDRRCGFEKSENLILRNKLMCTNSEESSSSSFFNKRGAELEQYLMKDIENSWSDPAVLSSIFSTSSLEDKVNKMKLDDLN